MVPFHTFKGSLALDACTKGVHAVFLNRAETARHQSLFFLWGVHLGASSKGKSQSHGDCQCSKCTSRCRDILHSGIYVLPSSLPWFPQISLVLIVPLKFQWSDSFTYIFIVPSSWVLTLILGRYWAERSPELHIHNYLSSSAGPMPFKCSYSPWGELCLRAMQRSPENVKMSSVWLVCIWPSGSPNLRMGKTHI